MDFRVRDAVVAVAAICTLSPLAPAPAEAAHRFEGFCSYQNQTESEAAKTTMIVNDGPYNFLQIHWHNDGVVSSFNRENDTQLRDTDVRAVWDILEAHGNTVRIQRQADGAVISCYSM